MGLITYNGVNPFSGQVDPLVSMSTSYDDTDGQWSRADTYSLNGDFTGCSFEALIKRQEDLVEAFSSDFKDFEIDGLGIQTTGLRTEIESISFGDANYLGAVPYSVNIKCTEFTQEAVLNPQDSMNFSEGEDGVISVSHNVSCVGIESGNCDALQVAMNWVNARLNVSARKPALIGGVNMAVAELKSISEDIDRIGYSYGINRNWVLEQNRTNTPILRYTEQECTEEDGTTTLSFRGTVEGGNVYSQAEVDNEIKSFVASHPYEYDSYSIDYDPQENEGSFSFSYKLGLPSNPSTPQIINNYSISTQKADGKETKSVDGCYETEKGKCGPTAYQNVQQFAGSDADILAAAEGLLGVEADNWSITHDERAGKICYNAGTNNAKKPPTQDGISSWSADFVVPVQQMKVIPVLNFGSCDDIIISLGRTNRASFSINSTSASTGANAVDLVKNHNQTKFRELCPNTPQIAVTTDTASKKAGGGATAQYAATFNGKEANTATAPTVIASDLKL